MPRTVDLAAREAEITAAAMELLATGGPKAVTLRALATRLGGSSTLVTHFYRNRSELLSAITSRIVSQYEEELAGLKEIDDPSQGLRATLEWLLPISPKDQGFERRRVMMTVEADSDETISGYLATMEQKERAILRIHLSRLLPDVNIESYIDILRSFTNGIALSVVESPVAWPPSRQIEALNRMLELLSSRRVIDATETN